MRVSFLVIKWESDKEPIAPADIQSQGIALRAVADSDLKQAIPYTWAVQHPVKSAAPDQTKPADEVLYRRWAKGDPLEPHKVELVFEDKIFYELKEGDWVKKDQLVALVDPTVQVDDVAIKLNKLETAESEYKEAIKTKEEAQRSRE